MMEQIRQRIETKLLAAPLQPYPFPHIFVDDLFPPDIFNQILEYNPFKAIEGNEWMSKRQSKGARADTPFHLRRQINLLSSAHDSAGPEQKAFWDLIRDSLSADCWLERLVLKKYREYFTLRFGELVEAADFLDHFHRELFLQRHNAGYYIGPHTDNPTRVFTCIFSFADRPGFEQLGTQLCVPKDRLVRCWGNEHHKAELFHVAKVAPYKPNGFLLFFKTRQSFHAVAPIGDDAPNQRYGMQYQFFEPAGGLFHDLSEPELYGTSPKITDSGGSGVVSRIRHRLNTFRTGS